MPLVSISNTVPYPKVLPWIVVPYRLPAGSLIKGARDSLPSRPVKV
jgi:hypothetical protein